MGSTWSCMSYLSLRPPRRLQVSVGSSFSHVIDPAKSVIEAPGVLWRIYLLSATPSPRRLKRSSLVSTGCFPRLVELLEWHFHPGPVSVWLEHQAKQRLSDPQRPADYIAGYKAGIVRQMTRSVQRIPVRQLQGNQDGMPRLAQTASPMHQPSLIFRSIVGRVWYHCIRPTFVLEIPIRKGRAAFSTGPWSDSRQTGGRK